MSQLKKTLYISSMLLLLILTNLAAAQNTFNLEVEIAEAYKTLQAGENIYFTAKILNLANKQRMDITLKYEISDSNNIIATKSNTVAIETQASFVGNIQIPENTKEGTYDLTVKIIINGIEEAHGKDSFKIIKKENKTKYYLIYILVIIVILFLVIYLFFKSKKIIEKIKIKIKVRDIVKKRLKK